MIKLCVFDCDGTLVDSERSIVSSMSAAFSAHGIPLPAEDAVRRVVGLSLAEAVARLLPVGSAHECARVSRSYRDAVAALRLDGTLFEPLYPGVLDGLRALEDQGWCLGLATGKSHRGAMATLAAHGLERRFVTLQTPDNAAGKPSPQMMFQAMAEVGAAPGATVMVGDTTYDMMMARSAGTLALAVSWGYHEQAELEASGAHAVVTEFAGIASAIARLVDPSQRRDQAEFAVEQGPKRTR
jgi:phosphoglycolate phosphatase